MRSVAVFGFCLLMFVLPAKAEMKGSGYMMGGAFKNSQATVQVITINPINDNFYAGLSVATSGCAGNASGFAHALSKYRMLVIVTSDETPSERCAIEMNFSKTFSTVTLKEQNCSYFHGASCGFEGSLRRVLH